MHLDEMVFVRVRGRRRAVGHSQLCVDVLDVARDGMRADDQLLRRFDGWSAGGQVSRAPHVHERTSAVPPACVSQVRPTTRARASRSGVAPSLAKFRWQSRTPPRRGSVASAAHARPQQRRGRAASYGICSACHVRAAVLSPVQRSHRRPRSAPTRRPERPSPPGPADEPAAIAAELVSGGACCRNRSGRNISTAAAAAPPARPTNAGSRAPVDHGGRAYTVATGQLRRPQARHGLTAMAAGLSVVRSACSNPRRADAARLPGPERGPAPGGGGS